jgi:hypothetical protein
MLIYKYLRFLWPLIVDSHFDQNILWPQSLNFWDTFYNPSWGSILCTFWGKCQFCRCLCLSLLELTTEIYLLTALEVWRLTSWYLYGQAVMRPLPEPADGCLLCVLTWSFLHASQRVNEPWSLLFWQAQQASRSRASLLWPSLPFSTSLEAPHPNIVTSGVMASTY